MRNREKRCDLGGVPALRTRDVWAGTGGGVESQLRLLPLGFLETESETDSGTFIVDQKSAAVEGRGGSRTGRTKQTHRNAMVTRGSVPSTGNSRRLGWPFRDARVQPRGLSLYVTASTHQGREGRKRSYRKEESWYIKPQETPASEPGVRVDAERHTLLLS